MKQRLRYKIRLPAVEPYILTQDQAYFLLEENGEVKKIRFHDYDELFLRPGLYEQIFYDRLKCKSPQKIAELLKKVIEQTSENFNEFRILDVGAGNGMMGHELSKFGVARIIGIDVLKEAYDAAERDYPGIYDDYYVSDLTKLREEEIEEIKNWQLNCLVSIAAIGFNDIPPEAFIQAFNLISEQGWIAINIKETFLQKDDSSGFSMLIKQLIFNDIIELYHLEKYQHRLSIDGKPLFYYAIVGEKIKNITEYLLV
ncbi:MAG: methyltransferase [Bacteroidia bacterium]|nr:methyltransferase [Bacteroidia bacterium]